MTDIFLAPFAIKISVSYVAASQTPGTWTFLSLPSCTAARYCCCSDFLNTIDKDSVRSAFTYVHTCKCLRITNMRTTHRYCLVFFNSGFRVSYYAEWNESCWCKTLSRVCYMLDAFHIVYRKNNLPLHKIWEKRAEFYGRSNTLKYL
jgi:hypothetical protein